MANSVTITEELAERMTITKTPNGWLANAPIVGFKCSTCCTLISCVQQLMWSLRQLLNTWDRRAACTVLCHVGSVCSMYSPLSAVEHVGSVCCMYSPLSAVERVGSVCSMYSPLSAVERVGSVCCMYSPLSAVEHVGSVCCMYSPLSAVEHVRSVCCMYSPLSA